MLLAGCAAWCEKHQQCGRNSCYPGLCSQAQAMPDTPSGNSKGCLLARYTCLEHKTCSNEHNSLISRAGSSMPMMCCKQMRHVVLQVTFHKVVEAEVEAASRGASADEVAHLTGQPENARLVTLLKGGALSVTINKGTAKQRPGTAASSSQPDLANQVSRGWLSVPFCRCIIWVTSQSMHAVRFCMACPGRWPSSTAVRPDGIYGSRATRSFARS